MSNKNPTERFSNRVDNYVKFRPSYPPEILTYLEQVVGLNKNVIIGDIGSGTGILTKLFLDYGCTVY
ncbi:MAG: class I SAM-dependent methyltransferase [Chloroflexota bacterium]